MISRLYHSFFQPLCLSLTIVIAALLGTGCRDREPQSYRVPKEPEMTMPMPGGGQATDGTTLVFETPNGWQTQPAGGMRRASFKIAGSQGKTADVSVIALGREASGLLENVNRWRGQLDLPPISESDLPGLIRRVPQKDREIIFVDFKRTAPAQGKPDRTLAAMLPQPDLIWFIKITGDDAVVETEKNRFDRFVQSLRFKSAPSVPSPSSQGPSPSMADTPVPEGQSSLQWTVPASWLAQTPGPMRKATYLVNGSDGAKAEVSVTAFPGEVGGLLANLNRWRGQLGLTPVTDPKSNFVADVVAGGGRKASLFDLSNPAGPEGKPVRMVVAVLSEKGDTWFFKMTGDAAAIDAAQIKAFAKMIKSIH